LSPNKTLVSLVQQEIHPIRQYLLKASSNQTTPTSLSNKQLLSNKNSKNNFDERKWKYKIKLVSNK